MDKTELTQMYLDKVSEFIKNFKVNSGYICVKDGYMFTIDGISIKYIQDDSLMFNYVCLISKDPEEFMFVQSRYDYTIDIVKFMNLSKIYNDMTNIFVSYIQMINQNQYQSFVYNNFHLNEDFIRINSLKSKDGAKPLIIDRHIIYMYKGLIPINKKDELSLTIYETENSIDLFNFEIYKKKQPVMKMILCCLNPNR